MGFFLFLLGMLVWQIVVVVVAIVTNEDEEKTLRVAIGLPGLIINLIGQFMQNQEKKDPDAKE